MNSQHVRNDVAGEEMHTFSLLSKSLFSMSTTYRMLLLNCCITFPRFFLGNSLDSSKLRLRIFQDPGPWLPTVFFQLFQNFRCRRTRVFCFPFCVKRKSYFFFRGPHKLGRRSLDDCRRGSLAPTQLIVNATALVLWSEKSVSGQVEEEVPKHW